jgi:hypothetical protein
MTPKPIDIVAKTWPWFVNGFMTRYQFYVAGVPHSRGERGYNLVRIPQKLRASEDNLADYARSTDEYFSAVSDGDCFVNELILFPASSKHPRAVMIVAQNKWRNLSGDPAVGPEIPGPTRLKKLILIPDRASPAFQVIDEETLDRYYCATQELLSEARRFVSSETRGKN